MYFEEASVVNFVEDSDGNILNTCQELIGKPDVQFTNRERQKLYFDEAWKYLGGTIEEITDHDGQMRRRFFNEKGKLILES